MIIDLFVSFRIEDLNCRVVSIEVILNPYLLICFIRFEILDILSILRLLIM